MLDFGRVDTAQFPPGEMLDDKYRIDALLSVGGMGAVYIGTHTLLRKRVAIKVLRTELVNAIGMVERFQREAVAASAIGHENIVTVTDMGKTQGGVAFLVMELLEGRSLSGLIKDDGPLAIGVACDVACEILSGISAAHRVGIVHRDLKPENVFMSRRGSGRGEAVKILDFGISSLSTDKPELRLTITGVVMGTPNYMAPEQARGDKEITFAADIYATAVILYEMLTKQIPYEAENYNLLMFRVLSGEYIKPTVRRPDLPRGLEAVILRAMALNPWDRFKSADDFAEALAPFRTGGTGVAVMVPPSGKRVSGNLATSETMAAAVPSVVTGARSIAPQPPKPKSRLKIALLVGGLAAVAAIGLIIAFGGGGNGKGKPDPGVSPSANPTAAAPTNPAGPTAVPTPTPAPTPTPGTEPRPPDPVPRAPDPVPSVVIEIQGAAADSKVFVGGEAVTGSKITLPTGANAVALRVERSGYLPYDGSIVPDRSKAITVPALVKKKGGGRPSGGGKDKRIVTDNPYGN